MKSSKNAKISNAVIKRLPRYRRYLHELDKKGIDKISSAELSKMIGYTASQIRQDLNNFGGFGQQGYGYNVKALYEEIGAILGLDQSYKLVIVGAGNLGHALTNYTYYYRTGFQVTALFDINPNMVGQEVNGIAVQPFENLVDYVKSEKVDIGVIATPKEAAQEVADLLSIAGVKGIWNFAPIDLEVPPYVCLEAVHLSECLYSLAYNIKLNKKKKNRFK